MVKFLQRKNEENISSLYKASEIKDVNLVANSKYFIEVIVLESSVCACNWLGTRQTRPNLLSQVR